MYRTMGHRWSTNDVSRDIVFRVTQLHQAFQEVSRVATMIYFRSSNVLRSI